MSFDRVVFTDASREDLRRLAAEDQELVVAALRTAKLVDQQRLTPKRLGRFAKTGDLSDCSRTYFGVEGEQDTHRMVFRDTGGAVEVLEVVAVSERTDDLPYLLAGLRLERIEDPVRRSDAQRGIARARKRSERSDPPTAE